MEYVRAARLVTHQVRAYISDILPLLQETLSATVTAVFLNFRLLSFLLRPLVHLIRQIYHILSPPVIQAFKLLYRGFAAQPPRLLAIEAIFFAVLFALLLLERKFRFYARLSALYKRSTKAVSGSYKSFHRGLRQKSRTAAAALPHLLFCIGATAFQTTFARFITPFTKGPTTVLLMCVKPAIETVQLLYTVDSELEYAPDTPSTTVPGTPARAEDSPRARSSDYVTPVTERRRRPLIQSDTRDIRRRRLAYDTPQQPAANDNPVSESRQTTRRRIASNDQGNEDDNDDDSVARVQLEVQALQFWIIFGLLWAIRTTTLYFCPPFLTGVLITLDTAMLYISLWLQLRFTRGSNLIYSMLSNIARRRWKLREEPDRLNAFLRLSVAIGLVSPDRAKSLESTFTESGLSLVGIVFLITPRLVTFLGTVIVGLLVPCFLSVGVIERKKGDRHNWLAYWSVYSLFDAFVTSLEGSIGWIPLWYHIKMLIILWLQVPYYRGCLTVLEWFMGHVGVALSTVRNELVTPRKRKCA